MRNQIEENADFINEEMAKTADENLQKSQIKVLERILSATPEERLAALGTFLDNVAPINASYAYNVDNVNKLFPGIEYTKEELDAAREAFIERRAQVKSMQMSDQPVIDEDLTEEEQEDVKDFEEGLASKEELEQPVDESGKSIVTDKYNNRYTKIINQLKSKFPTDYTTRFLQYLATNMANKFGKNTQDYKDIRSILGQFVQKKITEAQFVQAINEIQDKLRKDVELRKKNNTKFDTVENRINSLDLFKYLATRLIREEDVTTPLETAATTAATPTPTPSNVPTKSTPSTPDASTEFPQVVAKNKTLDSQLEIRLARLRFLATPIRSVGIEFDSKDNRRTDPADIRNAKAIEEIADQPYQTRIQSRKGTAMMFLAMKFPDKTEEQLVDDFATIEAIFDNTILTEEQWNAKGVEEQDAILEPMHNLLGKEYFDRSALAYFVANNGKGFTKKSTVSITSSDSDGNLNLFEGYPLQLNFPSAGRVSENVEEEYEEAGGNTQEIGQENVSNANTLARLTAYLSENTDAFIDTDYTVSEGVILKSTQQTKASELNNELVDNANLQDFDLATEVGQSIFGKRFNFKLGRVYFNNNGNPVILSNTNIDEKEAEAIAEMLFSENIPAEFRTVEGLENYLVSLINQVDKKNRIHFFPNKNFPSKTEAIQYPFNIVQTVYKDGKPVNTKLTKEEFLKFLKASFYKVDKKMLQSGEPMMRVSLVDGKPTITKQSYVDFLKETHTFPASSNGELLTPVNKVVYPDSTNFIERAADLLPRVQLQTAPIAPAPIKAATPVVTPQAPATQGRTIDEFIAIPYMEAVNFAKSSPTAQVYVYSAFVNFLTEDLYNQAVQIISDNPGNVTYDLVTRKLETSGKTTNLIPGLVPYSSDIEGDFILATVTLEGGKKIPLTLMRKQEGIGGMKFRYNALRVFRGNSPENFESMSKEEYSNPALKQPVAPTPAQPTDTKAEIEKKRQEEIDNLFGNYGVDEYKVKQKEINAKYDAQLAALGQPVAPKQSVADRLYSQSIGELFDKEEVQEAQKAKEDCINPAKQVKDQIKKKPKL